MNIYDEFVSRLSCSLNDELNSLNILHKRELSAEITFVYLIERKETRSHRITQMYTY